MPFKIIRNDITKVQADAIVNTANPEPVFARGTDQAIYRAAGKGRLLRERKKIGRIAAGEVAVTPAFRLHAKYIIHTVGPVWMDGDHGELELLASCYRKSLLIARQLGCKSIAFPLISTGIYGFPKDKALDIALGEFSSFLAPSDDDSFPEPEEEMDITLVVFDRKAFDLSSALAADVEQYIDENYVDARHREEYGTGYPYRGEYPRGKDSLYEGAFYEDSFREGSFYEGSFHGGSFHEDSFREDSSYEDSFYEDSLRERSSHAGFRKNDSAARPARTSKKLSAPLSSQAPSAARPSLDGGMQARSLQDVISQAGETFQESLLRMIDERGLTDIQVYKRANIDRRLFSKIRSNREYSPKRQTAVSLALALELNMDETRDLLGRAGMALSSSSKFDLIISYCIQNRIYDIIRINAILFDYGQPLLGA